MSNVVVCGLGVLSPIGNDINSFKESIEEGKLGIDEITSFNTKNSRVKIAGEVKGINFRDYMSKKTLRRTGRNTKLAIVSIRQAIEDSGLNLDKYKNETAIIIGTALGETSKKLQYYDQLKKNYEAQNNSRIAPYFMSFTNDAIAGYVAVEMNIKGINFSISCGCCSANVALIEAFYLIKNNRYKYVIVCGSEAPINPYILDALSYTGMLTKSQDRYNSIKPFDIEADGCVISEGAGAIILTSEENALENGNPIYCKVIGTGYSCDAHSMNSEPPTNNGKKEAIINALNKANICCKDINYINSYGCGLKHIDIMEIQLIKEIFPVSTKKTFVNSTKSMIGHSLGASSAIENIATILELKYNFIHPTINCTNKYEESNLDFITNESLKVNYERALKLSYATGNKNTAIIFEGV